MSLNKLIIRGFYTRKNFTQQEVRFDNLKTLDDWRTLEDLRTLADLKTDVGYMLIIACLKDLWNISKSIRIIPVNNNIRYTLTPNILL